MNFKQLQREAESKYRDNPYWKVACEKETIQLLSTTKNNTVCVVEYITQQGDYVFLSYKEKK